ncbi:DUF1912 family protein [Lactococcus fujiensis]|uniref:Aldose 1-epimerase n=1 Tax=Lactococcus fujiensis JCM 16395 TaxID=1291764 RepID=A0A2A5RKH8_9LACT|nr:DUF1912 family protein [Lactococcus fujiensis]PCR99676.1 hypothetical protein RT41_GL001789 [Lactococcus fujiensis JCM 16395]
MTFEQEFLSDFSEWVDQQVEISAMAMKAAESIQDEDPAAKDAAIRYQSRLEAYDFIKGKFENYKNGKSFHEMPDFGTVKY